MRRMCSCYMYLPARLSGDAWWHSCCDLVEICQFDGPCEMHDAQKHLFVCGVAPAEHHDLVVDGGF